MLAIIWLMSIIILPIRSEVIIPLFFTWVILGQLYLNLLARILSLSYTPKPKTSAHKDRLAKHYKATFSRKARVHFLGVWFVSNSKTSVQAFSSLNNFVYRDTVSSLGHLRSKDLPKTVDGEDHICVFRHALALDERRVKFLPEYRYGGESHVSSGNDPASPTSAIPKVKETWFRGSHADM